MNRARATAIILAVCVANSVSAAESAETQEPNPRALSWDEFIKLPPDSPIIIDNDSFFDVPSHFYPRPMC